MITWTVTTRPDSHPEIISASGAEPSRDDAKRAAADAIRTALLDAATLVSDNGTPPSYLATIDGDNVLIATLGDCRPANYEGILDALEQFDGTAPPNLLYL